MNTKIFINFALYMELMNKKYDEQIAQYNDMRYFTTDPVAVVRKCTNDKDIEVMGIVCSWLALGNRDQIFKKCNFAYDLMRHNPFEYLMSCDWTQYERSHKNFYRMFFFEDFFDLMNSLYAIYSKYETLEKAVNSFISENPGSDYLDALIAMIKARGIPKNKKSACKRMILFLRWMIRRDGIVDLGIWRSMSPAKLMIPLDVHVNRIARSQGLITRNASDMKAVIELTANCQKYYPEDPAIMDFALFGLGYTSK